MKKTVSASLKYSHSAFRTSSVLRFRQGHLELGRFELDFPDLCQAESQKCLALEKRNAQLEEETAQLVGQPKKTSPKRPQPASPGGNTEDFRGDICHQVGRFAGEETWLLIFVRVERLSHRISTSYQNGGRK